MIYKDGKITVRIVPKTKIGHDALRLSEAAGEGTGRRNGGGGEKYRTRGGNTACAAASGCRVPRKRLYNK